MSTTNPTSKTTITRVKNRLSWVTKQLIQHPYIQRHITGQNSFSRNTDIEDTIIVVRPENIGDIVLMTSFLADLKQDYPCSKIIMAGRSGPLSVLHGDQRWETMPLHCFNDNINVYDLPLPGIIKKLRNIHTCAQTVEREHRPRFVIHPRPDADLHLAGLFTSFFSGRSFGFAANVTSSRLAHNPNADLYYFKVAKDAHGLHEIDRVGSMLPILGSQQRTKTPSLLPTDSGITLDKNCITMGIGAASEDRALPDSGVLNILRTLIKEDYKPIIIGGPQDSHRAQQLLSSLDICTSNNLCGRIPLESVGHIISQSKMYIGPDSGLMHIATAVGVSVIAISGYTGSDNLHPNSPARFGPSSKNGFVVKSHANNSADTVLNMTAINFDDVAQLLLEKLNAI